MPAQGFVVLTLAFRQDGRRWTGECLELGTATYARTLKQAREELEDMVTLHLNSLEDVGERERFFKEHEIKFYTDEAAPREVAPTLPVANDSFFQPHLFPFPSEVPSRELVGAGA
jgi:hypothetical protein